MKARKMIDLTDDELLKKVKDYKGELFNLRFQLATGQLDNPMRINEVKKNIARAKTVIRQRELETKKS
ncbi:MAG: 50S ribosomal protein L29 [Solirubrobacterales bacterium]